MENSIHNRMAEGLRLTRVMIVTKASQTARSSTSALRLLAFAAPLTLEPERGGPSTDLQGPVGVHWRSRYAEFRLEPGCRILDVAPR